MSLPRIPRLGQQGWTLVELMVVTAILGIIIPVLTSFFLQVRHGMAADEMHSHLKKLNEETMGRLNVRVRSSKHMFQNDPSGSGPDYLALVDLTSGSPAPPPLASTGIRLPAAQPPSINSFSPSSGAAVTGFGNAIFFAAYDSPTTLRIGPLAGQAFTAPLTVQGAGVTYDFGGETTVVLDVYRFYLYYLTAARKPLTDVPTYGLVEWRSIQYVDFYQLSTIENSVLRTQVIDWLTEASPPNFPGGPILSAWDPSKSDPTDDAFIDLPAFTETVSPEIVMQDWTYVTQASSGILSGGFRYGISGNNQLWKDRPKLVPLYANENGDFPGGFEVGILGKGGGLQVMTRSLLVARGLAPRLVWNDVTMVHNARDIW